MPASDNQSSRDSRFGNGVSSPQDIGPRNPNLRMPSPENEMPIGLVSGKPMPRWPVPPPIFDTGNQRNSKSNQTLFTMPSGLLREYAKPQTPLVQADSPTMPPASPADDATRAGGALSSGTQPQHDAGPFTLNEAYLRYRKRLDASQSQRPALGTSAPAPPLDSSDVPYFSGGMLGRLTALMRQYPDIYGPVPQDDEPPANYGWMRNQIG
jgi:hypothetical protein